MFDRIAPRYDLLNHLLSGGIDVRWRRRAVDALAAAPGARVLDLCTGTADLLLEALARDGETRGAGLDFSLPMLTRAADKLARRGLSGRAGVVAADVQSLPVRDGAFDGALVAFGLRNVGEPARALAEARRVLRPGGRLVVLEFSTPRGPMGLVYRAYSRYVLPRVGGWISGDRAAYAYLPASVERFATPAELGALMEAAGFTAVRWQPLTGGIAHLVQGDRR
ncbi:MAG TPA: class I SAM-dependent methyltransferase [Vicinamibacteria bacterium]|nr:class I SAM-dependent methyltransferase [Vicinamibacteria bacterium]